MEQIVIEGKKRPSGGLIAGIILMALMLAVSVITLIGRYSSMEYSDGATAGMSIANIIIIMIMLVSSLIGLIALIICNCKYYKRNIVVTRTGIYVGANRFCTIGEIQDVSDTIRYYGIEIRTNNGRRLGAYLQNHKAVIDEIKKLMYEYDVLFQEEQPRSREPIVNIASSGADEIAKYKALLDQGAITPVEYEAKKRQILGL